MTINEAIELLSADDLTELGIRANSRRQELHPHGIVTYCVEPDAHTTKVFLTTGEEALAQLEQVRDAHAIEPVCARDFTATEYLKFLAVCRLYSPVLNLEIEPERTGLKVAQIALRFGANDLGNRKPSSPMPEEDIRRTIREAGFIPKRRDREYRSLSLY